MRLSYSSPLCYDVVVDGKVIPTTASHITEAVCLALDTHATPVLSCVQVYVGHGDYRVQSCDITPESTEMVLRSEMFLPSIPLSKIDELRTSPHFQYILLRSGVLPITAYLALFFRYLGVRAKFPFLPIYFIFSHLLWLSYRLYEDFLFLHKTNSILKIGLRAFIYEFRKFTDDISDEFRLWWDDCTDNESLFGRQIDTASNI